MFVDASELINETSVLFSPPIVYRRLAELLDEPKQYQDEIAEIISHDPGLIARVLKAANDVPYAAKQKIGDVCDAIAAINADDLRTLITTATAVETFSHVDTDLVDMNNFWNHSISCGLAAQVLAERCGHANPDQVFIAGVLHDIGQLVIYHALPELATRVLRKAGEAESYRYRAEKEIIGFTHAEVGAELINSWGLPDNLAEVVQFHHEPEKAVNHPLETALIHISTGVANQIDPSWKMDLAGRDSLSAISPHAWAVTGLSPDVIHPTLENIGVESFGVLCLIDPESMLIY